MCHFDKTNRRVSSTRNMKRFSRHWWNTTCAGAIFQVNLKMNCRTDIELEPVPLMELSSLPEHIHVKTRETSQNTDLYMGEY